MAALVTFLEAKAHLRVTTDDQNAVIADKLAQATDEILDYLKQRTGIRTGTITSSSVASPTVITMASMHPFFNGETVTIADHLTSVPSLTGSHVISNVTATTFTIPVNVTTAGTGGTASVVWTITTVPPRVKNMILILLTHRFEHPGDDMKGDADVWESIRRQLERTRDPALA